MPDPVREAIFDVLDADSELGDLVNGIYFRSPPSADTPYVIFDKMAGTRTWTFSGPPIKSQVWLVKGVGDAEDAEDIDARCQAILNGAVLIVEGHIVLLTPMPDDDVSYAEDTDGEHYEHVGTNYRVAIEEGS